MSYDERKEHEAVQKLTLWNRLQGAERGLYAEVVPAAGDDYRIEFRDDRTHKLVNAVSGLEGFAAYTSALDRALAQAALPVAA